MVCRAGVRHIGHRRAGCRLALDQGLRAGRRAYLFSTDAPILVGGRDSIGSASLVDRRAEADDRVIVSGPGDVRIRAEGPTELLLIDLGRGKNRLGGSALLQVHGSVGEAPPDLDDPSLLKGFFSAIQELNQAGLLLAYHDRSDGGLLVTLLALVAPSTSPGAEPARRPNVIVFLTDDNGYGDHACLGHPFLKTPHFDQLHAASVRLTGPLSKPMT